MGENGRQRQAMVELVSGYNEEWWNWFLVTIKNGGTGFWLQ